MKDEKKQDELDSLFPQKIIAGFELKPWSLRVIKELYPVLEEIAVVLKNNNITLSNMEKTITEKPSIIIKMALDNGAKIISCSLGIDEAEAEELEAGKVIELLFNIFFMNITFIKNSFGLIEQVKEEVVSTRP